MQRFFEAAFRTSRPIAPDGKRYAILPQQTQDELIVSSVHCKLDRVLLFLQEIGYVLLDDARPQHGGGVRLREPEAPLADRAAGPRGHRSTRIPKGEPQVDEEEAKQVIRFSTETAKYAQYPDDLVLVWRFTNILATANPAAESMVKQEILYKTVLQGIRLMHLCSYDYSDLVLTLAYASVYFTTTCEAIGHTMSNVEAAHVCVLLIFLAHCFVIDETCPLRYWQKYIFKRYCTLKVLDAALFRVFEMRNFKLRISEEDEKQALSVLLSAESGRDVILSINEGADARVRALRAKAKGLASTGSATSSAAGSASGHPHFDSSANSAQAAGSAAAGAVGVAEGHCNGHNLGGPAGAEEGSAGTGHRRGYRGRAGEEARTDGLHLNIQKSQDLVDSSGTEVAADRSGSLSTCTTAASSRDEMPKASAASSSGETPKTPKEAPRTWPGASHVAECRAAASEDLLAARSEHVRVP